MLLILLLQDPGSFTLLELYRMKYTMYGFVAEVANLNGTEIP